MSIWRPFTQEQITPPAIRVRKGDGIYIYTEDGRRFADMISSWWVNIHGHANKEIADAIAQQARDLEQVIFTAFSHQPAQKLIASLQTVLPEQLQHFFFSDNGSTAVEVALKMAYQFFKNQGITNRKIYLHLDGSYHGDTYGAMSVSGKDSVYHFNFSEFFFDTVTIPVPEFYDDVNDIQEKEEKILHDLEVKLRDVGENVCALIVEPLLQGAKGMVVYRHEFLDRLIMLVRQYNILVIFDEVMTGFYRTGRFYAMDYCSEKPDIVCLSKALTGGFLPLSITIASDEVYSAFLSEDTKKSFIHGHSYTGNPIACAAACKSFEILCRPETISRIKEIESFHKKTEILNVKKRRTLGVMSAFDVRSPAVAQKLATKLFESGIFIRPLGSTVYLLPPYCITIDELRSAYTAINEALPIRISKPF